MLHFRRSYVPYAFLVVRKYKFLLEGPFFRYYQNVFLIHRYTEMCLLHVLSPSSRDLPFVLNERCGVYHFPSLQFVPYG